LVHDADAWSILESSDVAELVEHDAGLGVDVTGKRNEDLPSISASIGGGGMSWLVEFKTPTRLSVVRLDQYILPGHEEAAAGGTIEHIHRGSRGIDEALGVDTDLESGVWQLSALAPYRKRTDCRHADDGGGDVEVAPDFSPGHGVPSSRFAASST
jgi:hypothetical protein